MISPHKSVYLLAFLILAGCSYPAAIESTPPGWTLPLETPAKTSPAPLPIPIITIPTDDSLATEPTTTILANSGRPTSLFQPVPMGMLGSVTTLVNVRTGPAQSYPSIGMLDYGDVVKLTGRDLQNLWYQFQYPEGSDGRAWAASGFIKVANGDPLTLPRFDNQGKPIP